MIVLLLLMVAALFTAPYWFYPESWFRLESKAKVWYGGQSVRDCRVYRSYRVYHGYEVLLIIFHRKIGSERVEEVLLAHPKNRPSIAYARKEDFVFLLNRAFSLHNLLHRSVDIALDYEVLGSGPDWIELSLTDKPRKRHRDRLLIKLK